MATNCEQSNSVLNNSLKPNEVPVTLSLTGTEYQLITNPTLNRVERILITAPNNFITIGNDIFRLSKGYTVGVKNTGANLEVNDTISDGNIYINSTNIYIKLAKYNGGTITDFGTYDPVSKTFTGGSYTIITHDEI